MRFLRTSRCFVLLVALLFALPLSGARAQDRPDVDADAHRLLKQMSTFLSGLQQFSYHTETTDDRVLSSGQLLQFANSVDVFVRRPDRLRANIQGDTQNQNLIYDGKTITLLETELNVFAMLEAPATIEEALDHALEAFDLRAPLSDLVYRNLYDTLISNIESGFYVGQHTVAGVSSHHLAFRQEDIDWQVWIEDGERPLPRKIVITRKRVAGAPQFTALLSDWQLSPGLPDNLFTFSPPDEAARIDFLPLEQPAASGQ